MKNPAIRPKMIRNLLLGFGLLVCLLLAAAGLSSGFKTAQAQQQASDLISRRMASGRSAADLMNEARTTGSVRVIVGLRAGYRLEGRMSSAAVAAQRLSIAQTQTAVLNRLSAHRATGVKRFGFIPFLALEVDAGGLEQLRQAPEVTTIEDDAMLHATLAESVPLIGAPAAWAAGFAGAGQTVAILDTGVDKTHPFLSGKVVSEACYSTSSPIGTTTVCPGGVAQSTTPGSGVNCSAPGCEHGTHVAGIAAGKSATFSGVARDADIIAIQVFSRITNCLSSVDCTVAFTSDVLLGLQRVQDLSSQLNIAAVNLSLGGVSFGTNCDSAQTAYKAAIDNLRSTGIATVVASGNDGNVAGVSSPACVSSAISVGSTGDGSNGSTLNAVSSFSNSGSFLNLLAPGEWINSSVPGGGFANFRGTSQATPHVTGAWAVLKSKTPAASVSQVLQALTNTGLLITDPRNGIVKPRIRVDAAVNALPATACSYALAPATQPFGKDGGAGAVNITAGGGCAWTAASNVPWITITGAGSGAGNGSVSFSVTANTGLERSGTIFIAGQTFIANQASAPALAVDDGIFENAIGLRFGGTICAVNRLTPTRYPAAIDTVGVYFQSLLGLPINKDITVLYGLNPSGSSEISTVSLQTVPGKVRAWDQFNPYSIPPLVANSGDFVVGFCVPHSSSELPVVIDQTPPSKRRSLVSLNGGAYQLIDSVSSSLAGNFLIRVLLTPKLMTAAGTTIASEGCATANQAIDPGETVTANFSLRNVGTEATANLVATLQASGGVTAPSGAQTYGDLTPGAFGVKPFTFTASGACGDVVTATLRLQDGATDLGAVTFNFPLGALTPFSVTSNYSYGGAPVPLPDNNTVEIPLTVPDRGLINNLRVRVRLDHPSSDDLDIFLVGPDGTTVELSTDNGGFGSNYGSGNNNCSGNFTVFDDAASASIISASAPFAGSFKPEGMLFVFNGKPFNGVWKLRITDDEPAVSGMLGCWQLEIARQQTVCCGSTCPVITGVSPETAVVGSQIMISGLNLSGVTGVEFAGNITANFTINSATQITATVPAGAKPGPITISKNNCPDFQIDFTALTLEIASGGPPALVNEECTLNNAIDPGERVTVNFPLRNLGTGATTNLVATLQPTGGVSAPSGPQSFGIVTGGGIPIPRPFTFSANSACEGTITATLQLQDGATSLGTVSFTLTIGRRAIFAESFDRVNAPALPTGWVSTLATGSAPRWVTSATASDTPPNNAFTTEPGTVSDIRLDSPNIAIASAQAQLSFRNNFSLDTPSFSFDGGVLEIAIGTDPFTDILAAGGSFVAGGYNQTVASFSSNPLAGRQVWGGASGGYITTTVKLPAAAAGKNIKLRWRLGCNAFDGGAGWRIDGITITEPACATNCGPVCHSVTNLNPTSGTVGSTVTITGASFTGVTAVKLANNVTAQFTVNSDTQITTTVPNGAITGPITISKPGCHDVQTASFRVCPTITLTPASLPAGTLNTAYNQTVTASGGAAPYSFTLSAGLLPNGLTLSSGGALSGTPTQQGSFNITVRATDANGCAETQSYSLVINCPAITLAPTTLPDGTSGVAYNQTLTASGGSSPYSFAVTAGALPSGLTLSTGGVLSGTPTVAGTANFTITALSFGPCSGRQAYTLAINNPAPALASLSPNSATAGGSAFKLSVTGSNFVNGATVQWNGANRATTFVNATQLSADITAADVATAGVANVTVVNPSPGGGLSSAQPFTINNPQPSVASLSPSPVTMGGADFTLTLEGMNFVNGSIVRWNGSDRATTYVSSMRLTAAIPAGDIAQAGTADITVFNPAPGGGASGSLSLSVREPNKLPQLTGLTPNPVVAGGQNFTLTVNGRDFVAGSTVRWDGNDRPTTFINATQLTAAIPAADIAAAREVKITVFTPEPGGGRSNEMILTIANAVANVSAASFSGAMLAPDSIVAAFGVRLATAMKIATTTPLPTELEGTTLRVKDSAGAERLARLFFVAPGQINYLMPPETVAGAATVTVRSGDGIVAVGMVQIAMTAPSLFTANADGKGVTAGSALRVKADGTQVYEPISRFDEGKKMFVPLPIDLGNANEQVFLILSGSGIRHRSSLSAVTVTTGGMSQQVLFAGAVEGLAGFDQVNVGPLSRSLMGRGEVDLVLTVEGKPANTARVGFGVRGL